MSVQETLQHRNSMHGEYSVQARIAEEISSTLGGGPRSNLLTPEMKQSLSMIAVKLARIVSGDPTCSDHWHDIAGYATLVEQRLVKQNGGD